MNILFIGDVFGKPGRKAVGRLYPSLVDRYQIDYTIANIENTADGRGTTPRIVEDFLELGVQCLTSGNHIWDQREILEYIGDQPRLLRPANYSPDAPGTGVHIGETSAGIRVGVMNLQGRVFMNTFSCPFRAAEQILETRTPPPAVWIVDMHAEATSEKIAMGWHLAGRVAAVVGTHTHVQTADERILPGGTAYLTDLGMTGPHDSVIGVEKAAALKRFLTYMPSRFTTAKRDVHLSGAVITVDEDSGKATGIQRIFVEDPA